MRHVHKSLALVAFLGTAVAVPAFAQSSAATTYPAACDASKVSKADVDRAHAVYLSGKQFLDESNYDKAISYFSDAYSIDCSVHAILPIIATAYERKGDKGEAVRALTEYLHRAPNAPDREHIERRIKNLSDQLAKEQPAPTAIATASASAPPSATTAPEVPPPPTASASPAAPTSTASSGSRSPLPWVLVGVGAATVVGGGALYIVGSGKVSSAEKACGGRACGTNGSAAADGNNGRSLETVGVVVGGVGIAAAGAGLLWYFLSSPTQSSSAATAVTPIVSPGYAGLSVTGAL